MLVPLAALGAIAAAFSRWVRCRFGWLVAAAAVANVTLVPLATGSGESLQERVKETALVREHTQMGEQLLPWVIALAVGIVAVMVLRLLSSRRAKGAATPWWAGRRVMALALALSVLGSAGALVQVVRIGHSGAKATWSDRTSGG